MSTKSFSIIEEDLKSIINYGDTTKGTVEMSAIIHSPLEDIEVRQIVSLDIVRDYLRNSGDYKVLHCMLETSVFRECLLPYRDNLDCSLTLGMNNGCGEMDGSKVRYKAFLLNMYNDLNNPVLTQISDKELDQSTMVELKLQLVDKEYKAIKDIRLTPNITFVGNSNMSELIFTKIQDSVSSLGVKVGGELVNFAFSMVKPDNEDTDDVTHKVIPEPYKYNPLQFPELLQELEGIYNGGIGCYMQRYKGVMTVFVYPIFDANSYSRKNEVNDNGLMPPERLMVFHYGKKSGYEGDDKAFWMDGYILKIPAGGEITLRDTGLDDLRTMGNMTINISPRTGASTANPMYPDNYPAFKISMDDGTAQLDFSEMDENPYQARTRHMGSLFSPVEISWNNGCPDEIFPGMPVQLVVETRNELALYEGTVVYFYASINKTYKTVKSKMLINVIKKDSTPLPEL